MIRWRELDLSGDPISSFPNTLPAVLQSKLVYGHVLVFFEVSRDRKPLDKPLDNFLGKARKRVQVNENLQS